MKKYIIVSIIVAALFVGGSIGVAKALTTSSVTSPAKVPVALSTSNFALNMARGLKTDNVNVQTTTEQDLALEVQSIIVDMVNSNNNITLNCGEFQGSLECGLNGCHYNMNTHACTKRTRDYVY